MCCRCLAHPGTAMIERAVTHAPCRASGRRIHALWLVNSGGVDFVPVRPTCAGLTPADMLPEVPSPQFTVRHTVGLDDPLTDAEVTEPLHDGLPHSLDENIRAFGLTHFKIKLAGHLENDTARLERLATLLPDDARFTLDANENYPDIRSFARTGITGWRAPRSPHGWSAGCCWWSSRCTGTVRSLRKPPRPFPPGRSIRHSS